MAQMKTGFECGPVSSYNAVQKLDNAPKISFEEFLAVWQFPNTGTAFDNTRDQPGDHLATLRKLNILHRRVTLGDLLNFKCPPGKTVVLLHNPKDPILTQHWARFVSYDRLSGLFHFDWGNGKSRGLTPEVLRREFEAGKPDYAYCVGEAETSKNKRVENWFWLVLQSILKKVTSWL
jgi:hypothetical protein